MSDLSQVAVYSDSSDIYKVSEEDKTEEAGYWLSCNVDWKSIDGKQTEKLALMLHLIEVELSLSWQCDINNIVISNHMDLNLHLAELSTIKSTDEVYPATNLLYHYIS